MIWLPSHAMRRPGRPPNRREATVTGLRVESYLLAARRDALQELCDEWLNTFVPPEAAIFRPAVPLVVCSKLFYPSMGDRFSWRTGTQSQSELYFAVPVERWRRVNSREVFVDYGVVTPFIFVDNPMSAIDGRERFGFPKEVCSFGRDFDPAEFSASQSSWTVSSWDPTTTGLALRPLARLMGASAPNPVTVAVDTPPGTPTDWIWNWRTLWRELEEHWEEVRTGRALGAIQKIARLVGGGLDVRAFNFRQFPDPEHEDAARYQDLVEFRMRVGDVRTLTALAGTHRLMIDRSELRPIAKLLGLRIHASSAAGDRDATDTIEALGALAAEVDIELSGVDRLCWRRDEGGWRADDGTPVGPPSNAAPKWNAYFGRGMGPAFMDQHAGSKLLDAKILLLPADLEATTRYLENALPAGFDGRVRPMQSSGRAAVRLLASRSRGVDPRHAEELVWLDGSYVSLSIPVELTHGGKTRPALFLLADFTDNRFMLHALRELALSPTYMADMHTPDAGWFASTRPTTNVLHLETQALERSADVTRIAVHPVLDVFTSRDGGTRAPASVGQGGANGEPDALWGYAGELRPMVSTGAIRSVDAAGAPLVERVMLADIDEYDGASNGRKAGGVAGAGGLEHVVLFYATETFPFIDALGFDELDPDSPDGALAASSRDSGRVRVVRAACWTDLVLSVDVRHMKILWEGDAAPRPRGSRR